MFVSFVSMFVRAHMKNQQWQETFTGHDGFEVCVCAALYDRRQSRNRRLHHRLRWHAATDDCNWCVSFSTHINLFLIVFNRRHIIIITNTRGHCASYISYEENYIFPRRPDCHPKIKQTKN
uniref:Uncharacterized protein n=1 Tax=Schizaphis graminum TaxID=13262 RepID=A0A2S2PPP7_SCHGA